MKSVSIVLVIVGCTLPSAAAGERRRVEIASTRDGHRQLCDIVLPAGFDPTGAAVPLLVSLHTWSADVNQRRPALEQEAERRGWICLLPNFRGRNDDPAACGSVLAQQDILDAVAWTRQQYPIDPRRIYLTGVSGGGHMTMLMVGRYPDVWAAASAWVGISDLAAWYGRHADDKYGQMMRACCGGAPGASPAVDREFRNRSPLTWLHQAATVPLDIAAGVHDGHTGSVPVRHSLEAFNVISRATGGTPVSEPEILQISRPEGRLDQPMESDQITDTTFEREIYLRRTAGPSRVTIFEGGHEGLDRAAIAWLARHVKPEVNTPAWIWGKEDRLGAQEVSLTRTFRLSRAVQQVRLQCHADFCRVTVLVDGTAVLGIDEYAPLVDRTLPLSLKAGEHTLQLMCTGVPGPSAVALSLTLSGPGDEAAVVTTDNDWPQAAAFGQVRGELWGRDSRPVAVSAADDYEQWKDAQVGEDTGELPRFLVPDGFVVERVRRALPDEGSWVSMAFDRNDRLVIAREDKGLLRMTLNSDEPRVDRVEVVDDSLLECRGLIFDGDTLLANANNSKGLYRLRDSTGDGVFDSVRLLRHSPGSVGHGRNDLAFDADGNLLSIHGDAVDLLKDNVVDTTSPFRAARRGKVSREGSLNQMRADGSHWRVLAAGLRNPFGVAVHPEHGEAFTYDADAEHDMGAPWYRPTRVVHLTSGADYGWRGVTGQWPPYFPDRADNATAVVDIGKGSPTAVQFGSASFPAPYRQALFILDWAYGRIIAVHLVPQGAGYRGCAELFVRGRPLNVTDLDFGPDGAMYVITGGRKTQSALYRIRYTGSPAESSLPTAQEMARTRWSSERRAQRRTLEQYHRRSHGAPLSLLWNALASSDPVLRHTARVGLEHQAVETWRYAALQEKRPTAALTGLMALARGGHSGDIPKIIDRLNQLLSNLPPQSLNDTQLLMALRTYAICLRSEVAFTERQRDLCRGHLEDWFLQERLTTVLPLGLGGPVERELSDLLVELGSPTAVASSLNRMHAATRSLDRLYYLYVLRDARAGWTPAQRRDWLTSLNAASQQQGGRGLPDFISAIREDFVRTLDASEKKSLTMLISPPETTTAEEAVPQRPLVREWRGADLRPMLPHVSSGRNFENGRRMFREALCSRCHRVGTLGAAVGPDLTAVGSRFSPHDVLESILKPSAVVAEPYRVANIVMTDGRLLTGQVTSGADYRARTLRVIPDALHPARTIEVRKRDIEEHRVTALSPMPGGLLNTLAEDEILDLLAWLLAGGDKNHPAFAPSR